MGSAKGGSEQTIGYKYLVGLQAELCHGPIDCLTRFDVDDRVAWSGLYGGGTNRLRAPTLFGGDDREGGVSGD
jgi:hypothetical protein